MRNIIYKGIPAVAALGALRWFGWRSAGERPISPAPAMTGAVSQRATSAEISAEAGAVVEDKKAEEEASTDTATVASAPPLDPLGQVRDALQRYREFTVYPPWSRPFAANTAHYVDWNKLQPEGQPFAVDEAGRELMVEVSLDRMFAGAGEQILTTVRAGRMEEGQLRPATFDKIEARIERNVPGKGIVAIRPLQLDQSGPLYSARFAPSEDPTLAERPQEAMVTVEVRKGVFFKTIRMPFQYAAAPPLKVLGVRRDALQDGSLVVELEVDVVRLAPTLLQAVLYDSAGRVPIAIYDDYIRPTELGRQPVPITFFGRAIREKNVNGPYSIRALHGVSKDLEGSDLYWKRDDAPVLLTHAYSAAMFSGAEWESPEKRAKIAQYEEILRAGSLVQAAP